MVLAAIHSFWQRRKQTIGLFFVIIAYVLAIALINLISPEFGMGYLSVSFFRVMYSITPLLIILIALNLDDQPNEAEIKQ